MHNQVHAGAGYKGSVGFVVGRGIGGLRYKGRGAIGKVVAVVVDMDVTD